MNRTSTFFILLLLLSFFTCCNKARNTQTDLRPSLNVANEIVWSQSEFRFIFNMIIRAQFDSILQTSHLALIDSALVSYKPLQHKYSFCFTGLMSCDSVHRSGRFEVTSDTCFLTPGSVTTINFIDYDDETGIFVSCTDSIIFRGTDGSDNLLFTNRICNGALLKFLSDSASSTFFLNAEMELTVSSAGFTKGATAEFIMKGSCSGTSSRGHVFTAYVDTLENEINCPWFSSGTIHFTIPGAAIPTGQISFIATDGCNNRVNYDFEGNAYHWTIDPRHLRN